MPGGDWGQAQGSAGSGCDAVQCPVLSLGLAGILPFSHPRGNWVPCAHPHGLQIPAATVRRLQCCAHEATGEACCGDKSPETNSSRTLRVSGAPAPGRGASELEWYLQCCEVGGLRASPQSVVAPSQSPSPEPLTGNTSGTEGPESRDPQEESHQTEPLEARRHPPAS